MYTPVLRAFTIKEKTLDRPNFHFAGLFFKFLFPVLLISSPPSRLTSVFKHDSFYEVLSSYAIQNKLSLILPFLQVKETKSFSVLSDHRDTVG